MMELGDIGTGLAVLGASQVTKDAIERMLAPTADYIGAGLLSTTKASVNLARVLMRAVARRRGSLENASGIPPRVLKGVIDEAPFCEDEITAEYLGGVLAASWNDRPRDDRGVAYLATIRRLSTYSLRTHCVLYQAYASLHFNGQYDDEGIGSGIHIPEDEFIAAMQFGDHEPVGEVWAHSIGALERDALAEIPVAGSPEYFQSEYQGQVASETLTLLRTEGGLVFRPTVVGTELFLAGCGLSGYLLSHVPADAWDRGDLLFDGAAPRVERCRIVADTHRDPRRESR